MRNDFNAMHAPIGAHSSFTLGCRGQNGGLGLELGGPADDNLYIGASARNGRHYESLPFFAGSADHAARYVEKQGTPGGAKIIAYPASAIRREFRLGVDTWAAGDLSFAVYSPVEGVPDPARAKSGDLKRIVRPSVLAELTLDNRKGNRTRRLFFSYSPKNGPDGMRQLTLPNPWRGVGQGPFTAVVTDHPAAMAATGFTLQDILGEADDFNHGFALGPAGAIMVDVPAGKKVTLRLALCFFRGGLVTTGLATRYFYSRYFKDIEAVARYSLQNFELIRRHAEESDRLLSGRSLNPEQRFQLIHAIRAYYASTQFLEHNGKPLWVVNEGEYRMLNTFDLTVDQVFYELKMNPWTVRNELDLFVDRYSYRDRVHAPGSLATQPGGLSFTHDMGQRNQFAPPGRSGYEKRGLKGCFSHMTHEQLVNWVLCAALYVRQTDDRRWRDLRLPVFRDCLRSMLHRDASKDSARNGVMGLDSARTGGGAEITTYDSLDESLGQARNNGYMAVKSWAAYLALEELFRSMGLADEQASSRRQAERAAQTIVAHRVDGEIPALLGEGNGESRIIPVIEGLVFPWALGLRKACSEKGPYGELIAALREHLHRVLRKGVCLYPNGAWKLSSTADNSWLSKIYLCQFVAREILGLQTPATGRAADRAHARWLLADENIRWAWSDQMKGGLAKGSLYYPRGVTAILWLEE